MFECTVQTRHSGFWWENSVWPLTYSQWIIMAGSSFPLCWPVFKYNFSGWRYCRFSSHSTFSSFFCFVKKLYDIWPVLWMKHLPSCPSFALHTMQLIWDGQSCCAVQKTLATRHKYIVTKSRMLVITALPYIHDCLLLVKIALTAVISALWKNLFHVSWDCR